MSVPIGSTRANTQHHAQRECAKMAKKARRLASKRGHRSGINRPASTILTAEVPDGERNEIRSAPRGASPAE